jgi:hypothetical protein
MDLNIPLESNFLIPLNITSIPAKHFHSIFHPGIDMGDQKDITEATSPKSQFDICRINIVFALT